MHRPRAFTLTELLVSVAIIALLLGVLLPSLAGARRQAKMVHELAASRQLMQAYLGYAMDNSSSLIAGHTDETPSVLDDAGQPLVPAEVVRRWPWRIVSYLGAGVHGTLLVNEQSRALADRTTPMWSYMVSLTPSVGLNYFNLGGDLTAHGANNAPGCLTRLDTALTPARMITFASARSAGEHGSVHGYFKIVPPTKAFEYSADGWSRDGFSETADPAAWGYVHPRWSAHAVVALLDGAATTLGPTELRDMTRWSNAAALAGDPDWRAP